MNSHAAGFRSVLFVFTCVALCASQCGGQSTQFGTTVQLPTFHVFGTSTTVIVPDRGSVYLGGVNRSAQGRNSLGVPLATGFGNRGIGHASTAAGLSVSATIIDHDAIDRALLAEAARRRGAKFDVLGRPVSIGPGQLPSARNYRKTTNLEKNNSRAQIVASDGAGAESGLAAIYIRRGRQTEVDGQPHAAKIFYQRAAKHGSLKQKQFAEARLAHIESAISTEPTDVP